MQHALRDEQVADQVGTSDAPVRPQPFVSVIIPVRDDAERLKICLLALDVQTYPAQAFEVIVVDDGSRETLTSVERLFPEVRFLRAPRHNAYSARNCGLAAARGEVIAFTDADCIPQSTWLAEGIAFLQAHPCCGLLAGEVRFFFRRPSQWPSLVEHYDSLTYLQQEKHVRERQFGATANVFTRRSVLDAVGTFDPSYPYFGDVEWGRRVHRAGWELHYADDVRVRHPARRTLRAVARRAVRIARDEVKHERTHAAVPPPRHRRVRWSHYGSIWRNAQVPSLWEKLGLTGIAVIDEGIRGATRLWLRSVSRRSITSLS